MVPKCLTISPPLQELDDGVPRKRGSLRGLELFITRMPSFSVNVWLPFWEVSWRHCGVKHSIGPDRLPYISISFYPIVLEGEVAGHLECVSSKKVQTAEGPELVDSSLKAMNHGLCAKAGICCVWFKCNSVLVHTHAERDVIGHFWIPILLICLKTVNNEKPMWKCTHQDLC